jgi:hypothetical protein
VLRIFPTFGEDDGLAAFIKEAFVKTVYTTGMIKISNFLIKASKSLIKAWNFLIKAWSF